MMQTYDQLMPGRPMTSVTIRIPATTANLGPGYDCLGLALSLENQVSLSTGHNKLFVEIFGEGAGQLPNNADNLVVQAAFRAYQAAGQKVPSGMHVRCKNRIPNGSGMGSSAAAVLAGLLGANALMGNPLSIPEILRLGTELEGHPDNITAALFGGLVLIAIPHSKQVSNLPEPFLVRRIPILPLDVAVAVPAIQVTTQQARQALPDKMPLEDVVYNLGRSMMVVEALRSGDLTLLSQVMKDRLHQPYRLKLIPGAEQGLQAALQAGASAAALSGAGPGIIAFCPGPARPIADAMVDAFEQIGVKARGWALRVSESGYRIRGVHE